MAGGFVHGKDSVFTLATKDITAWVDSLAFSQSVETAETSCMGVEAKTYISGLSDATISFSGKYDSVAVTGPDAVISAQVGADVTCAWIFGPEGSASGSEKYSGNCYVTSYEVSAPLGDVVAYSAELQITGPITKGVY